MTTAQIGIYGLGTMGSALALNLAGQGIEVAVTNREPERIAQFMEDSGDLAAHLRPHETLAGFVAGLQVPRIVLFMIPSGQPMDDMIEWIVPLLDRGDTIIDAGNADFHDTRRRAAALAEQELHFVGMGVSGGEQGARHGPSMMVGGSDHSWQQLSPILRRIAARFNDQPCVAHLGPDGAGHFVKTVHNGIEYADMQMIAEVYGLMRNGLGLPPHEIGDVFDRLNDGPLASYLIEITARILHSIDPETGHPMLDVIKDSAGQKGTGRWTVIEALRLGQSASTIEAAVGARSWSSEKDTRQIGEETLGGARLGLDLSVQSLADALMAARILAHAQGFRVLTAASQEYDWQLDLARIAEIWRAGCIIRSALLDDVAAAFHAGPRAGELILAPAIAERLALCVPALREVVAAAVHSGHAVPALSAALAWYDTMRQGYGTANVIQAQRDVFGRHGFERLGQGGKFHGPWWE
ncbi:NADP-dependent phosphogluconate dehydrogenase [Roseovarius sp. PS-C2]|uniref:NADP-dependent phosphogluconate dehydrogenase n=1 Tax=Roseovarius sp. PS-C2 TaxID=2820814 RepID=UPI001C0B3ACF|nr:NADP-dependent phosphogluconate dehydrogenase [Roseovarius sp. PS-C2]MBU3261689.1 NADP-dependent phosphogluconate dehydrogenase [Roseovarius sp. PS-C2]